VDTIETGALPRASRYGRLTTAEPYAVGALPAYAPAGFLTPQSPDRHPDHRRGEPHVQRRYSANVDAVPSVALRRMRARFVNFPHIEGSQHP